MSGEMTRDNYQRIQAKFGVLAVETNLGARLVNRASDATASSTSHRFFVSTQ
jgi:hypothetical protein